MSRMKGDSVLDKITGEIGTVIAVHSIINETTLKKEFQYLIKGVSISENYPADKDNPSATWRNSWDIERA